MYYRTTDQVYYRDAPRKPNKRNGCNQYTSTFISTLVLLLVHQYYYQYISTVADTSIHLYYYNALVLLLVHQYYYQYIYTANSTYVLVHQYYYQYACIIDSTFILSIVHLYQIQYAFTSKPNLIRYKKRDLFKPIPRRN